MLVIIGYTLLSNKLIAYSLAQPLLIHSERAGENKIQGTTTSVWRVSCCDKNNQGTTSMWWVSCWESHYATDSRWDINIYHTSTQNWPRTLCSNTGINNNTINIHVHTFKTRHTNNDLHQGQAKRRQTISVVWMTNSLHQNFDTQRTYL